MTDRGGYASSAAEAISRKLRATANRLEPFRATAKSDNGFQVELRRLNTIANDEELYARLAGFAIPVDADVAVLEWGGSLFVLGWVPGSAPTVYTLSGPLRIGTAGATIRSGSGTPEGAVTGNVGDVYLRTNGAAGTILYEKATGAGTNTGWVANASTGSTTLTVEEGDSVVDATVGVIDFNTTAFNVTESPEDEANIGMNFGTGAGQPAEGNHNHDADYADIAHTHGSSQLSAPPATALKSVQVNPGATTATTMGMPAALLNATVANADDSEGPWISHTTGSVSGNATSVRSDLLPTAVRRDWQPDIEFMVKLGATISSYRFWAGLFDAVPNSASDPTLNGAAFRYATDVDGTAFWRCWSNDNSGGGSVTTTSVAVAANGTYRLRIKCNASDIEFYIDDVLVATHSSNLPVATTMLGYNISLATLTGSSRAFSWSRIMLTHGPF